MTPRNVLHIVTQLELGGAQRTTLELLARLNRRKFTPALVSSDGLLTDTAHRIPGLSVTLLPSLRRDLDPLADGRTLMRLVSLIRRGGFDLVHTHSSKAGILGRWAAHLAGTPVIVHTVHGFGFHRFQPPWVRRFYQFLERRAARLSDGLIVVSERDRQTGVRLGLIPDDQERSGLGAQGSGRKRMLQHRLIRYGIEAGSFRPNGTPQAALRESIGLDPSRPVVGTVACLKPQKAPADFVRACHLIHRHVPEAQFVLVGDGALRPRVERWRRRLGLVDSLHLVGWRHDVPTWLAAMDIFVLASRWEGLPIACLEAMAAGLPIVCTTAGGTAEVVRHGHNGLLVPVAHPQRLAEAVVRLLHDPALRRRMGGNGCASLNGEYTLDRMVRDTERFYDELFDAQEAARC